MLWFLNYRELGPLLFLAFINDLPECTEYSTTRLFADDCVLYKRISSHQDAALLQEDLEALQKWEATWLMQFHPFKCQVVRVTNKRKPIAAAYNIHAMAWCLKKFLQLNILGFTLTRSWLSTHTLISPARKLTLPVLFSNATSAIAVTRSRKQRIKPTSDQLLNMPPLHGILTPKEIIRKIEQIQRSSARYVTNNYDRRSSVTALLSKLEWPSLQERQRQSRLTMLFRIRFNLVDINWRHHLTESTSSTRGHSCRFWNPHYSSQVFTSSFFPRTSREWNNLKKDPADFQTLDAFKMALREATI